jgi:hypothetical protein
VESVFFILDLKSLAIVDTELVFFYQASKGAEILGKWIFILFLFSDIHLRGILDRSLTKILSRM